ncbi:MAG: hypothetical protein M3R21_05250 [Candidatus Dormibacteraeota bacterium]|nr:hypothetical protein [Candidatus Dormibacteraeota bacterium]
MTEPTTPHSVDRPDASSDTAVDQIVDRGPGGAFAVAGVATAIVLALYFAFYFFAYLPRGVVQ